MPGTSNEDGQAALLVVGFVLVVVAVAGVAVDVTRASLLRRSLQSAADSAASIGASQLDRDRYYGSGGAAAHLEPDAVARAAREVLDARPQVLSARVEPGRNEVRVRVGGRVRTSFLRLIGLRHVSVSAEAVAVPVLGEG